MKNTKQSITFKVLIGYLLLTFLIAFAFWFIYPQIESFIYPPKEEKETNRKLTYISNALSYLYEAETLGRTAMANGSQDQFELYNTHVDSILMQIDGLQEITDKSNQNQSLDSIKIMLDQKTENMQSMVKLREEQYSHSFYDDAISELIKEDIYFEDYENDPRLKGMDPYAKKVLVDWAEYIRKDNADPDKTMKAMAETVRSTLAKIENRKKNLEVDILNRENELLQNDRRISLKIRNLLSNFEQESYLSSRDRENKLNLRLTQITRTLKIIGGISLFLALGFVIMVFRDASKSQQYNNQLIENNAVTQSLLKSREQLMATITHDMRSPLNTVIGFTDLLKETDLDSKQAHYLKNVKKSSDYILRLVNDLLDFSKLQAGRVAIEKVAFNPKNLIEDVVTVALPSQIKIEIEIITTVPDELDQYLVSDPFRIKQILSNLITNAYKFTEKGSITIEASYGNNLKNSLQFKIIDTGIGIPEEKQKLIFKEFSQADEHIERKYGGFGLGLAITQKLVELLHGNLSLESKKGDGSTFIVTIPVEKSKSLPAEKKEGKRELKIPKINRILIVDDEPLQLALASEVIDTVNIPYDTCNNGEEALKLVHSQNYDLIFTDIQMPVMDGIDLIKSIKKEPKLATIPVVALSGNDSMAPADYKNLGFSKSLKKPYSPQSLLETISSYSSNGHHEVVLKTSTKNNYKKRKGFSLEELSVFADNDPESLKSIIKIFIESTKDNKEKLNDCFRKNNISGINQTTHKMLPMFRQLQAEEIVSLMEKLESPMFINTSKKVRDSLKKVLFKKIDKLINQLKAEIKD